MIQLIECVPNFSEGNNINTITKITKEIKSVEGVQLLDVDMGKATNRTVVTFVGTPKKVCQAAFLSVKKASELIDMSKHKGAHPRFGATDVLPLIPISGITMKETVNYARKLGKKIGTELNIPVYLYEKAANTKDRRNLATIRSGEYEKLDEKLKNPKWKPDFGPDKMNCLSGATAVGARNFLVAYNINLNTTSTRRANAVAFDIREKGRIKREGNNLAGKIMRDEHGKPLRKPGALKCVKAIGWYIKEYGIAQISINLTDITETSIHEVFDTTCEKAHQRGLRVTGSELVGLVPLQAMLNAGKHYLKKQKRSTGIPDEEIIKIAVKSLGLDELKPFDYKKKIIEYILEDEKEKLINLSVKNFTQETASESLAPGGGSISATIGAYAASLATMVANLSAHKRGWDEQWKVFSNWADKGKHYYIELLKLVDEDTKAFNQIIASTRLPSVTKEDKKNKEKAIETATKNAINIPFKVMQLSYESMEVIEKMAQIGNPNSISDVGVAALAAKTAVLGAHLNVKINTKDLNDTDFINEIMNNAKSIIVKTKQMEDKILKMVDEKIDKL